MVRYQGGTLDAIFSALADPTRRAIVSRLAVEASSVSELAAPFDMTLGGIAKHLSVLEHAGLVAHNKEGRVRTCRLLPEPLLEAADWLVRQRSYWESQFDAVAAYLEQRNDLS